MSGLPLDTFYCTTCDEVVSSAATHRQEAHDGDIGPDLLRFNNEDADGNFIYQLDTMGHFTPHQWDDVEGTTTCMQCGAVKVDPDEVFA